MAKQQTPVKKPTKEQLEQQVFKLEKILEKTPEVLGVNMYGGKIYNSKWFSLTGKIKQIKAQIQEMIHPTGKNAWNEFLAR